MFNKNQPDLEARINFLDKTLTEQNETISEISTKATILQEAELPVVNEEILALQNKTDHLQNQIDKLIEVQQDLNSDVFGMLFAFKHIIVQTELYNDEELEKAISHFKNKFSKR